MSWQSYAKDHLKEAGAMLSAGIYGKDGAPWATEGDIAAGIKNNEIVRLVQIVEGRDKNFLDIMLGGKKYVYTRHDEDDKFVYLTKSTGGSGDEKNYCCAYVSKQCVLLGFVGENHKMGNCSTVCCKLRNYLNSAGY